MKKDNKNVTLILARNIREKRKKLGLTQDQLAGLLGITQQSLCRMEKAEIAPRIERLPEISECLNCQVIDLFRENYNDETYVDCLLELFSGLTEDEKSFVVSHTSELVKFIRTNNKKSCL